MIIGISMGVETCQILGQFLHNLLDWPDGNIWSGVGQPTKLLTSRPDHLWPELWKSMGQHAKLKEKQKWAEAKIHLDNARKLRGICFIDRKTRNSKKPSRTRVRIVKNCGSGGSNKIKTKLARVFWKLMNPPECVWETLHHQITKTILQEKVRIHCNITIWCTNLFLCLKLWKFQQQKQRWTRNGKIGENFGVELGESQKVRNRWSRKQGRRALQFILHHWWTYVIWKMLNWTKNSKNTKVELFSEVILHKTIQDLMQFSPNKDLQHFKWQPPRSWISSPDCQEVMDNSRRGICLHPSVVFTRMSEHGPPNPQLLSTPITSPSAAAARGAGVELHGSASLYHCWYVDKTHPRDYSFRGTGQCQHCLQKGAQSWTRVIRVPCAPGARGANGFICMFLCHYPITKRPSTMFPPTSSSCSGRASLVSSVKTGYISRSSVSG